MVPPVFAKSDVPSCYAFKQFKAQSLTKGGHGPKCPAYLFSQAHTGGHGAGEDGCVTARVLVSDRNPVLGSEPLHDAQDLSNPQSTKWVFSSLQYPNQSTQGRRPIALRMHQRRGVLTDGRHSCNLSWRPC